jgi:DNA-binding transcriptional MerR regulator
MTNAQLMTVSAFARICGITAKTLRWYADIGLFRPAFIDPRTRYRYYAWDQVRDFARLRAIRACGASLTEIRRELNVRRSAPELKRFMQKLRTAKLRSIDEARRSLAWLEGELQNLETASPFHATITYCPPVRIASLRADLKHYSDVHAHERLLWESVASRSDSRMRGVLWHRCADRGVIDSEPFIELGEHSRCAAGLQPKELQGVHVARTFSSLDDDEAEQSHVSLSRWIRERGYRLSGPRREIYRGMLLEIQHPLHPG